MQNDKQKKNRFRKLVPTSNIHHDSANLSRLPPEIPAVTHRPKGKYASLQRESSQQLGVLRQRQVLQRRLKTLNSMQEREEQGEGRTRSQFSDHNIKIKKEMALTCFAEKGDRVKLSKMAALIGQFKSRVDHVMRMQPKQLESEVQALGCQLSEEQDLQQEAQSLIQSTKEAAARLIALYLGRTLKNVFVWMLPRLKDYLNQKLQEQVEVQEQEYLVSSIQPFCPAAREGGGALGRGGRERLLDVNKFFGSG